MSFNIIASRNFENELKKLSKKYPSIKIDLKELVDSLLSNPFQGDSLGKDCYKVRMKISSKGQGKSGGSRVITCIKVINNHINLLSIYDKSSQSAISESFLIQLLKENDLI